MADSNTSHSASSELSERALQSRHSVRPETNNGQCEWRHGNGTGLRFGLACRKSKLQGRSAGLSTEPHQPRGRCFSFPGTCLSGCPGARLRYPCYIRLAVDLLHATILCSRLCTPD